MKLNNLTDGIFKNNAIFKQMLGLCPTLAVTTSAENGLAMGLATMSVLICSNIVISLLSKLIPSKARIPAYIVIIACFVTVVDLFMNAYFHSLHKSLGLFIPLIVVNCIVLGRAEAFASKNKVFDSILDAIGTGIGFTISLTILAIFRELIGVGSIFGVNIMPDFYFPVILAILPPGAFIFLGFILAFTKYISSKNKGGNL